jgi:uncharacterized peroxidase-related enzyme
MSYIREVSLDETNYPAFAEMMNTFGFIPNFYRAQTIRPDLIEAQNQFVNAILIREGALTRKEKEYIFLVCSAANLSTYCVTAHCEIIRMLGIEGPEPEQIAIDHASTRLPMAVKALLNFAAKLNSEPTKIGKTELDDLHTYGYVDEQILETVLTVGLAKFANLVSSGLGTAPDFDSPRLKFPAKEASHAAGVVL